MQSAKVLTHVSNVKDGLKFMRAVGLHEKSPVGDVFNKIDFGISHEGNPDLCPDVISTCLKQFIFTLIGLILDYETAVTEKVGNKYYNQG